MQLQADDAFDGAVARATRSGSRFGEELDSLVDAISFGLAPALIMYFAVLNREARQVMILRGSGHGGVYNPDPAFALRTGADPLQQRDGAHKGVAGAALRSRARRQKRHQMRSNTMPLQG